MNRPQKERPLTNDERDKIIKLLQGPLFKKSKGKLEPKKSASVADIRVVLGFKKIDKSVGLNIEKDEEREINTDWFYREIIHNAFGEKKWVKLTEEQREYVNRAVLRFDPSNDRHRDKLRKGAIDWWGLTKEQADKLIEAWEGRPKKEKRLNLSRRAILNLLPYMNRFDEKNNRWPTQQEASKSFADDKELDEHARRRYLTGTLGANYEQRYYMKQKKHWINCEDGENLPPLPPAPMMTNPVVRKAIHEVRRHIMTYIRRFGCKPDRVVIEFARSAKQAGKVRDATLALNRKREKKRKEILESDVFKTAFGATFINLSLNQQRAAVDRVLLTQQQMGTCPYCGKGGLNDTIAASGEGVEIDHIVPFSRCGDNSMNNKVLCHIECNREKRKRTPREWWGDNFKERVNFAKKRYHEYKPDKTEYFTKKDYSRKWKNFTREVKVNEWRNSQGSDTAYAAKQVAAYLADALFEGKGLPERGGERKIFVTIGKYTAMLRRDWQLFEKVKRFQADGEVIMSKQEEKELEQKNRGDHRQHAIDAVVIALTEPGIISSIAKRAAIEEEIFAEHGHWPGQRSRREACSRCKGFYGRTEKWPGIYESIKPPEPWDDVKKFRKLILSKVYNSLIVSHRPAKRRIAGEFHEDTLFGTVKDRKELFTGRIQCFNPPDTWLEPKHLRLPQAETEKQAVNRLIKQYMKEGLEKKGARKKAKETAAKLDFRPQLIDPSPGKGGLVRNLGLRRQIRQCLKSYDYDPDDYSKEDMKKMVEQGLLRMYTKKEWNGNATLDKPEKPNGIPIKSVVLLRIHKDPEIVPRKKWDPIEKKMVQDKDPRTLRVYVGGNNHHIEIYEDEQGKWEGEIVTNFEAAKRNAKRLQMMKKAGLPSIQKLRRMRRHERQNFSSIIREINHDYSIVNHADIEGKRFIMSLAEGETIKMRHHKTGEEGYFVVFKLQKPRTIYFKHHWDARLAGGQKDENKKVIPSSKRENIAISASDLKTKCLLSEGKVPCKVRVNPLGEVKELYRD